MPNKEASNVRFSDNDSGTEAAEESPPPPQPPRRRLQRPFTAAAGSVGAPFLDAAGQRTQPSRDEQLGVTPKLPPPPSSASSTTKRRRGKKKRRPKTAPGLTAEAAAGGSGGAGVHQAAAASTGGGGGSEPNFPTLNPRVFHALRGFLTPESLRKTKFYSDREDRMSVRRQQLDSQQSRLHDRIGGFYQRLDSFIAETNAAAQWEPEDKRKQKSLLDELGNL